MGAHKAIAQMYLRIFPDMPATPLHWARINAM